MSLGHPDPAIGRIFQCFGSVETPLRDRHPDFFFRERLPNNTNRRSQIGICCEDDRLVESILESEPDQINSQIDVTFFFFVTIPLVFAARALTGLLLKGPHHILDSGRLQSSHVGAMAILRVLVNPTSIGREVISAYQHVVLWMNERFAQRPDIKPLEIMLGVCGPPSFRVAIQVVNGMVKIETIYENYDTILIVFLQSRPPK